MCSLAAVARLAALATAFAVLPLSALAHDYQVGAIKIDHPWSKAAPKGFKVGGGYMRITNTGNEPDRLIGGTVPFAARIEVHEMKMDGGTMKMRELKDGLEIKPGETVELKPGGYHVMFMELKEPLVEGKRVKGTLVFQKAGTVEVEYAVEALGAKSGGHDHSGHGGHSDHGAAKPKTN